MRDREGWSTRARTWRAAWPTRPRRSPGTSRGRPAPRRTRPRTPSAAWPTRPRRSAGDLADKAAPAAEKAKDAVADLADKVKGFLHRTDEGAPEAKDAAEDAD
ncbi:MAG: hypothetical protein U0V56_09640 [Actinomycetota bacterium]